jgi:uncharacterized protein YraI
MPPKRRGRRLATLTGALAIAAGALLTAAPSASAVGSAGCNSNTISGNWATGFNNVNLRNGPSTSYYSKGQLAKGSVISVSCTWISSNRMDEWMYGKVISGNHAGTWGWVYVPLAHIA